MSCVGSAIALEAVARVAAPRRESTSFFMSYLRWVHRRRGASPGRSRTRKTRVEAAGRRAERPVRRGARLIYAFIAHRQAQIAKALHLFHGQELLTPRRREAEARAERRRSPPLGAERRPSADMHRTPMNLLWRRGRRSRIVRWGKTTEDPRAPSVWARCRGPAPGVACAPVVAEAGERGP